MEDKHLSNWTITEEEIKETKISTRGENQNPIWFENENRYLQLQILEKQLKSKWNCQTNLR